MLGFFLIQQTLKTFRELVQLMWIETLLPRRKNSLRNAVKKFCPMRNSRCWYLCPNWYKSFLHHQQGPCCCLGLVVSDSAGSFLSSILQFRFLHLSPFLSMTDNIFLKPGPCPLPARLDLELWSPVFSERSTRRVGRWARNCTEACRGTAFQFLCSRALLTNLKPPHLLPSPPAFPPLMQGMNCREKFKLWLEICVWFWLLCSEGEGSLAKRNWRMALAQGTARV